MPYKSSIYHKSNGKPELKLHLSRNYDFVFTNLLKNEAELFTLQILENKPYLEGLIIRLKQGFVTVTIFQSCFSGI